MTTTKLLEMTSKYVKGLERRRGSNCPEKPETLINVPLGMYHCPYCGMMIVAGCPHPEPDDICIDLYSEEIFLLTELVKVITNTKEPCNEDN